MTPTLPSTASALLRGAPSARRSACAPLLLALLGCGGGGNPRSDSGVAVGNPGSMRASAGREAEVEVTRFSLSAKQTLLDPCDDAPAGQGRAVLGPTDGWGADGVAVPAGAWCALELRSVSVEVEGASPANPFALSSKVGALRVELGAAMPLGAGPLLLVLGGEGWLGAALLDSGGEPLDLKPNDPRAEQLVAALAQSSVFLDNDGDGELSAGDAPVAAAVGVAAGAGMELPPLASAHGLDSPPEGAVGPGLFEGFAVVIPEVEADPGRGVLEGDVPADVGAALDTGAPLPSGPDEHPGEGDDRPQTDEDVRCDDDDDDVDHDDDAEDDDHACDDDASAEPVTTDGA